MVLSKEQLIKIEETLKDFKCLVKRYNEVKNNPDLLDKFISRNRNPLFDMTSTKYWKTGLVSNEVITKNLKSNEIVNEHFIPRKIAMGLIFKELSLNENMDLTTFIELCKRYSSTIGLTKEEHNLVTKVSKGTGRCSYVFYEQCGIIVEGINDLISESLPC